MEKVIEKTCWDPESKDLFRAVVRQVGRWADMWEYPEDFRDASAGVSGFCYYSDTEPFAEKNIRNILHCLNEFEEEIGEPLKKDNDNLLNWYAWFALEHIVDKIMVFKEGGYE
ncbi:MAG: hypothetical protein JRF72_19070 [Deltaproteobacteria bacterium]|nr:hypothetical protein [Deltaproteobacteria bacterium]